MMYLLAFLLLVGALFGEISTLLFDDNHATDLAIEELCRTGDLYSAEQSFRSIADDARAYHCLSALQLILHANVDDAVDLHKLGKSTDFTAIPPLAKRHLDKQDCAGLGDLFYVSAVIIKELVDTNKALPNVLKAMKTLITLTSDSGLHHAAENAMQLALTLDPSDVSLHFRAAVMTPGVYESMEHINSTRTLLTKRIAHIADPHNGFELKGLDEFTMSPTFYFVYQGQNDETLLSSLQQAYIQAHPKLGMNHILENVANQRYFYQHTEVSNQRTQRKIRVGFVSSHFRRHSICKLFCGIMTRLNPAVYEVYAFSSLQENREDAVTQALRQSHITYVPIGMTFVQNRREVTDRAIDILVYLDVGMDPSTAAWAAARLAPVQMVIWGHPSTTGYASIDYYLSSEKFHRHRYDPYTGDHSALALGLSPATTAVAELQETTIAYAHQYFTEQLVLFDTLGFYFERPQLDVSLSSVDSNLQSSLPIELTQDVAQDQLALIYRPSAYYKKIRSARKSAQPTSPASQVLVDLITRKLQHNITIALCPQHMPKFHPHFDVILTGILLQAPNAVIALVDNRPKLQWRRVLMDRWRAALSLQLYRDCVNVGGGAVPQWCSVHVDALTNATTSTNVGHIHPALEAYSERLLDRIIWVPSLTPQEYLTLLAVGDVMLDPFPFGGGVTTLESLAVCTPVLTLPSAQSVPQLAAGMLYHMELSPATERILIAASAEDYLHTSLRLLGVTTEPVGHIDASLSDTAQDKAVSLQDLRRELCGKTGRVFSNSDTIEDWNVFLQKAVGVY